jgi:hypothetical protein
MAVILIICVARGITERMENAKEMLISTGKLALRVTQRASRYKIMTCRNS